jgi:hypothetical protein
LIKPIEAVKAHLKGAGGRCVEIQPVMIAIHSKATFIVEGGFLFGF